MLTLHNLHTLLATTTTHMAQAYSLPNWRYFTNAHIPFTTYRWEDSAGDYHITYNIPRDHASSSVLLSWKLLHHGNIHKGSMRFTCKGYTEGTEINGWHLTDSKAWKNGTEVYHLNLDPIYLEFQSLILPHLHHIDRWVYEC